MTVSVCMGVFNGEQYIEEQLRTIWNQTRKPDEVILCDDGSTDQTREIVKKFIETHHLEEHWKLICNEENKGYPFNFYYAMSLCTMDVVFLADQDDVWNIEKIERMLFYLEKDSKMQCLCCQLGLIDEDGKEIRGLMTPKRKMSEGKLREVSVEEVFYKCEWPGMVLAYRRAWLKTVTDSFREQNEYNKKIPHDFLICALAAEENGFFQLQEKLADHRRHASNTGKEEHRIRILLSKERKLWEIDKYLRILSEFEKDKVLQTENGEKALQEKTLVMRERKEALESGKWTRVLSWSKRHKGMVRKATVLCDLFIVLKRVAK